MQDERAYSFERQWVEAEAFRGMDQALAVPKASLTSGAYAKYLPQRWKRCTTQTQFFCRSKAVPSGSEVNPKVHSPYGNIFLV